MDSTRNAATAPEEPGVRARPLEFELNPAIRTEVRPNFALPFAILTRLNAFGLSKNANFLRFF